MRTTTNGSGTQVQKPKSVFINDIMLVNYFSHYRSASTNLLNHWLMMVMFMGLKSSANCFTECSN